MEKGTETLGESCKPKRKDGGYRRDDHRKEGRSCQRRHGSKKGGKSDKERQTDGRTELQDQREGQQEEGEQERLERQERK